MQSLKPEYQAKALARRVAQQKLKPTGEHVAVGLAFTALLAIFGLFVVCLMAAGLGRWLLWIPVVALIVAEDTPKNSPKKSVNRA